MNEPTSQISLEDVRTRFIEAEAKLGEAGEAIASIQGAAERLGSAREGLGTASLRLAELATSLGEVAGALTENAEELRHGVDAIRAGDPAEIKRQIDELDSAFGAMQSVMGERLTQLDAKADELGTKLVGLSDSLGIRLAAAQRESRILGIAVGILIIIGVLVSVLVR